MAKKESLFDSVLQKFSAKRELPSYEIKPAVLNELWNGFHLGALYSMWGQKGCGKCLEVNSRVVTTKGYLKFKDLLTSDAEYQPSGIMVYTPTTKRMVDHLYYKKDVECIKFHAGKSITCTPNHLMLTVCCGHLDMRKAAALSVGDYIAKPLRCFQFNTSIGNDLSYALGYTLGGGESFGVLGMHRYICYKVAQSKEVPEVLYTSTIENRLNFLYGLLDADAYRETPKGATYFMFTSVSKTLVEGIASVLETLGIYGNISTKTSFDKPYYKLEVPSSSFLYAPGTLTGSVKKINYPKDEDVFDPIPYSSAEAVAIRRELQLVSEWNYGGKRMTAAAIAAKFKTSGGVMSRRTLLTLRETLTMLPDTLEAKLQYKFVPIKSKEIVTADVADVALAEEHLFYSEGTLSHNTSLTLQLMKSLCKQGLKGVFVDVEKAFNEFQQKSFGLTEYIDNGQLIVLTVDTWKDFEEVVLALDDTDDIKFLCIDSVSMVRAYTPKELKVEDVRPGLKSQQAASVLGKLKSIAYQKEIGCVLLYHARANIQIMGANPYAPQDKMAGGFADFHIVDCITKIQAHSKIKGTSDDEPIGVEISIVTEKNKFKAPFQVQKGIKLIFGKGIDAKITLIEKALELGVITQKGSFFIVPNHDNVRGRQNLYNLDNETLKAIKVRVDQYKSQD